MPHVITLATNEHPRSVLSGRYEQVIGRAKVLAPKLLRRAESYDESSVFLYTVVLPYHLRGLSLKLIKKALAYTFNSHGCNHDYDCCGCSVRTAYTHQMRRVRRGVYTLPVSYGRNY